MFYVTETNNCQGTYVYVCECIYIYKYIYMCMFNAHAQECVSMHIPCLGSLWSCTWEQRLELDVFLFIFLCYFLK